MRTGTIDVVSLGCSKALVDSERLMGRLEAMGYRVTHDSTDIEGEVAIVNTCGFIRDAQQESIDTILALAERKREGRLRRLYVMGCLSQRWRKELTEAIPEVDRFYGKFDWDSLLAELSHDTHLLPNIPVEATLLTAPRKLTTPPHYAYLKVSEGCDRQCGYCAIPLMTGRMRSVPMEQLVDEARELASRGVKELNVVAQELTGYGLDLYGHRRIAELTERLADVEGLEWIRLHYAYPEGLGDDLLRVMSHRENVCNYLDIALQHISDPVLTAMRRGMTGEQTWQLLDHLREMVPGLTLRTTLMVGFPTETEREFEELRDFVLKARIERLGAFAYSEEEGTHSQRHYRDLVSQEEKERRLSEVMNLAEGILRETQEKRVGEVVRVIVDREEGDTLTGRTEGDSPEVDTEVRMRKTKGREQGAKVGDFVEARIDAVDAAGDLEATIVGGEET